MIFASPVSVYFDLIRECTNAIYYYTTIGDLSDSGSVHLYGVPGIATH